MTILVVSTLCLGAAEVVAGPVETVAEGFVFTEGPVWLPGGPLIFSDIPANKIYRADKTVFRDPSGNSNGLTLDKENRLIAAEHGNRRVSCTEADGTVVALAERFEGKRLNSPNDVVVRSDGTIFFTDPPYGLERKEDKELDFNGVYAIDPKGVLTLLVKDFVRPNGLALSPDEKVLYIADTQESHIRAFDVAEDGTLSGDRLFCDIPGPDGMKVDVEGNVWCTSDGVRVMDPAGALLADIAFPQRPANCAFGDDDMKTLYVTARKGVYKVRTAIAGIRPGK